MTDKKQQPNYFEFYELPVKFHPELSKVKAKFYALSKKYHPDFYANESAEKQEEVLQKSTENNKAYKILSNDKRLVKYVLELKKVLTEGEQYVLSQEFLMDMMDVNEMLMDLELDEDAEKLLELKKEVRGISSKLNESLIKLTVLHDDKDEDDVALLRQIKDVYYRQKYVWRLQERLKD
ncbi:molecular chaperone HscB [Pedobacter sp. UYP30]|uniref:iron-sulfur cluster co-chaperone HscB C-terminal domain-containing protein n=1 Tax=Pedobacter sp. UYP30 TaxID=1756400 RepID=UPI003391FAF0